MLEEDKIIKFYTLEQKFFCLIVTADSLFMLTLKILEHTTKCLPFYKQKFS